MLPDEASVNAGAVKKRAIALPHRREVDGLRALAVVPVLLFHAGYSTFKGGFVGVDVFFVISGFLISSIILREAENDRFSMLAFYERRARRILPALYLVLLVSIIGGWFVMSPWQMKTLMESVLAVSLFASNFYFWRTTDYFAQPAEESPLLHTWSLAVEEQFYIFFPPLLVLLWRRGRTLTWIALTVIAIVSIGLAEWGWRTHPVSNFYLAPGRIWELVAGAMLAIVSLEGSIGSRVTSTVRQIASLVGVALIMIPVFVFDTATPFPSFYALVPVVGTMLVIGFAVEGTFVCTVLATKFFVAIGLISYSLYLWHQPIFALARVASISELSPLQYGGLILAAVVMAVISWRFVEAPFRDRKRVGSKGIAQFSAVTTFAFLLVGVIGWRTDAISGRVKFPDGLAQSFNMTPRSFECFDILHAHDRPSGWECPIGTPSTEKPDFFVFGDSHAMTFLPALEAYAGQSGERGEFTAFAGCAPLLQTRLLRRRGQDERDCAALGVRVFEYAKTRGIGTVILIARWTYFTDGDYKGRDLNHLGSVDNDESSVARTRKVFADGVDATIAAYAAAKIHLVIVEQVPMQRLEPKTIYYKALNSRDPSSTLRELSVTRAERSRIGAYVTSVFDKYRNDPRVTLVNFDNELCDAEVCPVGTLTESYFSDDDHLSIVGAKHVGDALARALARVIVPAAALATPATPAK